MKPSLLPGLTGLRGIGALWVVFYHAQFGRNIPIAEVGYLGVDLFFMLSGFVLSHAHFNIKWSWLNYWEFLQSRFARIFPLHWVCLILTVIVIYIYPNIRENMPNKFYWSDLILSVFLVQNWGLNQAVPWNVPSWSLSTEWLMSIAFPLFLSIGRHIRPNLAAFLCGGCLITFAVFLYFTSNIVPDVTLRAGMVRTVCEFTAGCLLYRFYESGGQAGLLIIAIALSLILLGSSLPNWSIIAVFGFPIIILLAADRKGGVSTILEFKVFQFLGEISFSIYLLHWIFLQVSDGVKATLHIQGLAAFVWFICFLFFIITLSALTYFGIEKPARAWLRPARLPSSTSPK